VNQIGRAIGENHERPASSNLTHVTSPVLRSAAEFLSQLGSSEAPFLLDVREPDEFVDWAIPGALNIPLGQLPDRTDEIPRDRDVVVICAKGGRATAGASILLEKGFAASVLDGGMSSWAVTYDSVSTSMAGATVVQVRRRGKGCLSYVVAAGGRCAVIDPSTDLKLYFDIAEQLGVKISYIFDTHLHADHISGGRLLREETGADLILNPSDPFHYDYTPLTDGMSIELDEGVHLRVEALRAPGHTEGSTIYRLADACIFTGDTLFLESVGRPDLADQAEPFARALYHTLHERVLPLPDDIVVLPAHWGDAVEVRHGELVAKPLGELRPVLPALAFDEEAFVAWAVKSVKDRPPNYVEIVRYNAGDSTLTLDDIHEKELGPNRCAIA
jgi:glyoxylase-like metal-dependent hydrolase (beta-lactamase superfamily II)/rhodanese-related sulfurtransferase